MTELPMRQREVLDFMREFFYENDQLPPMKEIAKRFRFNSANTAFEIVRALEGKGYIERNAVKKFRFARVLASTKKAGQA